MIIRDGPSGRVLIERCGREQEHFISLPPVDQRGPIILPDGRRVTPELLKDEPHILTALLATMSEEEIDQLISSWWFLGRAEQLIPNGNWPLWLYLAGRGAGKTRTGGELSRELIKRGHMRLGLIAPTAGDVRDVMVEGESGIVAICRDDDVDYLGQLMGKPLYEPSKRRLTWKNGAQAALYSADEPERLRGPQHDFIWADELVAWRYPETWDLAMFGLRLRCRAGPPRAFVSTTPKPKKIILEMMKDEDNHITRGRTLDNQKNLAPAAIARLLKKYAGTRLGKQELDGELLLEAEGALWNRELLDKTRKPAIPQADSFYFMKIVVAVDPAVSNNENSNETGIVVIGLGNDEHGYVLADYSGKYSPGDWARKVCEVYRDWQADVVVAEGNQGGALVEHTIRSANKNVNVKMVHASRGKAARAEPIAAFFEQGRAHFVGSLPHLEDQCCVWEPLSGEGSPDRLDAMVWGLTACMIHTYEVGEGETEGGY